MFTTSFAAPDRFLSTLPARGATAARHLDEGQGRISIHAPREGSDGQVVELLAEHLISIHAPREGSDTVLVLRGRGREISIHAPREGSDLVVVVDEVGLFGISIHAPREGSDVIVNGSNVQDVDISIHAPREGSELYAPPAKGDRRHFYPRSPRGERPRVFGPPCPWRKFLSTLPARGATLVDVPAIVAKDISIHAPREGSDLYPSIGCIIVNISIHAPREGSDEWSSVITLL